MVVHLHLAGCVVGHSVAIGHGRRSRPNLCGRAEGPEGGTCPTGPSTLR